MKLYVDPIATSCRTLLALIDDQKLPVEVHTLSLANGDNRTPAFLAMQPSGKVPVLVDDEFVLTESLAIARYLLSGMACDLYPTQDRARARVDEFIDWISTGLAPAFLMNLVYPTFVPQLRFEEPAVNDAVAARARSTTHSALTEFDRRLEAGGPFATGETLTLADYVAAAILIWAPVVEISFDAYPHVARWRDGMRVVEAWLPREVALERRLAAGA
jgi:glutathione S-transferase